MSIDIRILDIICCPVTRLPIEAMSEAKLHELNACIRKSQIFDRNGTALEKELQEALITRDGKLAYPVENGIPVLLEGRGIDLLQMESL
ncbi:MAG: hypothetical protein CMM56_09450 [Rhodospirillaceae bacterium]|nr:hypothetical protein [Rhodospirillaceae bacterium]|tara:strand:+ start:231 stop:497 length:267 start_codon:yes stop_codon:yes gene_type:complete